MLLPQQLISTGKKRYVTEAAATQKQMI